MHSYYLLIHISQGQDLPSISKEQKLYICSQAPPLNCCMLLPPLLDLPCLNIFVHFAKSLKHLLPPPLLLGSRTYLAKTWNGFPHQKPILPSFSLTPSIKKSLDCSDTNLCLPLLSFSLHRAVAISQKQLNRAWLDLSSVYLCCQWLLSSPFHVVSTAGVQISHLFFLQPVPDHLLSLPLRLCCIVFYSSLLKWKYRTNASSWNTYTKIQPHTQNHSNQFLPSLGSFCDVNTIA